MFLADDKERVTEQPNPSTVDLDVSPPRGMVDMFARCDAAALDDISAAGSLWSGPLARVTEAIAAADHVILGGCGTSGRVAYLLARQWDGVDPNRRYSYSIAGGDGALFAAREAFEDSSAAGARDLSCHTPGPRTVYIGITCGMSAMYVAGQLESSLDAGATAVLLGFNPILASRPGFLPAAQRVQNDPRGILVTARLGPEAVCGSSRMKGGTFTKALLEIVFARAHGVAATTPGDDPMGGYRDAWKAVYEDPAAGSISRVAEASGAALSHGGRISYVARGSFAVVATIDASEQRPTFGADEEDIRAYALLAGDDDQDGSRYSSLFAREGPLSRNTARYFADTVSPSLDRDRDVAVLVWDSAEDTPPDWVLDAVCRVKHRFVILVDGAETGACSAWTHRFSETDEAGEPSSVIDLTAGGPRGVHAEIALKWALNAVSTSAHVIKGTVYRNRMVNLMVTNAKLFHRSVDIISSVAGVTQGKARTALLRSIYEGRGGAVPSDDECDGQDSSLAEARVPAHLEAAAGRTGIVPLAILLALDPRLSTSEAAKRMADQPRVRLLLSNALQA